MKPFSIVMLSVVVGCGGVNDLFCDEDTPCTNPERPFCDLNGDFPASEGIGRTCIPDPTIPPECQANETVCENDFLVTCDADGNVASTDECLLGCHDTELRCNKLDPSNGLAQHLDDAETEGPDVILGDGAVIDTDTGAVTNAGGGTVEVPSVVLPSPEGGVSVRVFKFGELVLGDVNINGARAAAIVSNDPIEINGDVVVQPGAGDSDQDCLLANFSFPGGNPGGAGGSFGTRGGQGGASGANGGRPSSPVEGNDSLIPLRGGCSGVTSCLVGEGCSIICSGVGCGNVGRGGGVLQLVSGSAIAIGNEGFIGRIEAPGGGASPGTGPFAGHGGGSGGGILIEAPTVTVASQSGIFANGGGGSCTTASGRIGDADGSLNAGECDTPEGSGGSGATSTRIAGTGGAAVANTNRGGGGGGGLGRIRINTADGSVGQTNPQFSPAPVLGSAGAR